MILTYNDLKKYIIDNGVEETVGVARNKINVYRIEKTVPREIFLCKLSAVVVDCVHDYVDDSQIYYNYLRYNCHKDVIQIGFDNAYYTGVDWYDLKDKDNLLIYTDKDDIKAGKISFKNLHIKDFEKGHKKLRKKIQKQIRECKQQLKRLEDTEKFLRIARVGLSDLLMCDD